MFPMHKSIAQFQRTPVSRATKDKVQGALRAKMEVRLDVRPQLNRAAWHKVLHDVLPSTVTINASSSDYGE